MVQRGFLWDEEPVGEGVSEMHEFFGGLANVLHRAQRRYRRNVKRRRQVHPTGRRCSSYVSIENHGGVIKHDQEN